MQDICLADITPIQFLGQVPVPVSNIANNQKKIKVSSFYTHSDVIVSLYVRRGESRSRSVWTFICIFLLHTYVLYNNLKLNPPAEFAPPLSAASQYWTLSLHQQSPTK
jgi:hypothetical protein